MFSMFNVYFCLCLRSPSQMDRVYKEERNYILNVVKKIKASGCNVLLIQKSILRDAVTDLALHYLVRGRGGGQGGGGMFAKRIHTVV